MRFGLALLFLCFLTVSSAEALVIKCMEMYSDGEGTRVKDEEDIYWLKPTNSSSEAMLTKVFEGEKACFVGNDHRGLFFALEVQIPDDSGHCQLNEIKIRCKN